MADAQNAACPDEAELRRYLADVLTLDESSHVESHVETCSACENELRRMLDAQSFDIFAVSVEADASLASDREVPTTPGYECLELLDTGGFGIVWKMRDRQFNRPVAVKVLKARHAKHSSLVRRFFAEAQICSQLSHPCIVPIHDMGTLQDGRPYLAMKLVEGMRLNDAFPANGNESNLVPRVEVFRQLCQAIAFAHENSVIHRDLKPQNVMVGRHGEVQVMDWGLARKLDDPEGPLSPSSVQETVRTHVDQTATGALGTYAYMAPEQAADAARASKASDVFSLGAILCELLTGKPPHTSDSRDEAAQMALAGDVTAAFERLDQCSANPRLVDLAKACLAHDAADRPSDAESVHDRVVAYLAGVSEELEQQKVENARQQQALLELGKRKRLWGALALALLVGVIAASAFGFVANDARKKESIANSQAQDARKLADQRADNRQRIVDAFVAAFKATDPRDEGVSGDMTAADLLESARANVASPKFADDVRTANELKSAIAKSFQNMGRFKDAIPIFEETVGVWRTLDDKKELAEDLGRLSVCHERVGQLDPALEAAEEVLTLTEELYGAKSKNHLRSIGDLALLYIQTERTKDAIRMLSETLEDAKTVFGEFGVDTLIVRDNLASAYEADGQLEKAVEHSERASSGFREHHPGHPETLQSLSVRAAILVRVGRQEEATRLYESAYESMKDKLSIGHENTLIVLRVLADQYRKRGRMDKAIALYKEAIPVLHSTGSQRLYTIYDHVGCLYLRAGKLEDARKMLAECAAWYDRKLPSGDTLRIAAFNNLAQAHVMLGQHAQALPILEDVDRNQDVSENPANYLITKKLLATCYQKTDRVSEAINVFRDSVRLAEEKLDEKHPLTVMLMSDLAGALNSHKQYDEAEQLYRKVMQLQETMNLPPNHGPVVVVNSLAIVLQNRNRIDEAIELFEKAQRLCEPLKPRENRDTIRTMINLGSAYAAASRLEEAEELLSEVKSMSQGRFGEHYLTTLAIEHYQTALLQREKFSKAKLNGREWVRALENSGKTKQLPEAQVSFAEALIEIGDYQQAADLLNSIEKSDELDPEQRIRLEALTGWLKFKQGDTAEAAKLLTSAYEEFQSLKTVDVDKRWYSRAIVRRLVNLHESSGDTDAVKLWQERLEKNR